MFGSLGQHLRIFSTFIHLASLLNYHQAVKSLASIRCIYVSVTVSLLPPPPGLDLTFVLLALSPVVWPEWERRTGDCCWRSASLGAPPMESQRSWSRLLSGHFWVGTWLYRNHPQYVAQQYVFQSTTKQFTSKSHLNVKKNKAKSQANADTKFYAATQWVVLVVLVPIESSIPHTSQSHFRDWPRCYSCYKLFSILFYFIFKPCGYKCQ